MQNHHLERDADRGGQAVDDHPDAVTDEENVAALIQQFRDRGGVGREADKRHAALGGRDIAHRLAGGLDLGGHGELSLCFQAGA